SGAIAGALPELKDELLAFAGASNLLTYATGLYISLFIALPMAERIFKWCSGSRAATSVGARATVEAEPAPSVSDDERPERRLGQTAIVMAVVCAVGWISNTINGAPLLEALPGMLILYAMTMLGLLITRFAPFYLPGVAWVSLVSIAMTLPWFPGSGWIVEQLSAVSFLAIVTPVLAYAGLALSPREFTMFRQVGWKLIIVSLLVFTGTFVGSALVAQALL
ncbi:MAG: DUF3100 domain-containing protein, partial [Pseudomonadota bacterium]|nr:DUF3100 domain-containing protein [Pseudomonadota bacterium]